jgi:hypothetical protein
VTEPPWMEYSVCTISAGFATSWLPAKVQRLKQSADSAEEPIASLLRV